MTAPVAIEGLQATLSRIAQIQAQFSAVLGTKATTTSTATASATGSTGSATSATDFASALSAASQTADPAAATASGSTSGNAIVDSAKKYLGVPYVWGGTTAAGLDCSGLVQKAYGDLGISLPRLSYDQAKVGTAVKSLAEAQPGDILGFGNPAEHVAIYLGNNMMIAAPEPGDHVKIQSVYETPASIRRVVGTDAATSSTSTVSPASSLSTASTAGVSSYTGIFAANEAKYSLPTGMLAAVAQTESGGNAGAVSPAGAQGLMQLMPTTAAGLGVNPWDPSQAVKGAAQLLSNYLKKYDSVPLALAAYNAGPGAVDRYNGVPPFTETQNYVKKITALMGGS
ncbi:NlpC/P60 family protein [Jatrophihabitans telluris]|uniref:NlpC/P60 family protein n=1 Tax=Jatrophihabitans telluris TaxID=2038343 RepID=UPI0024C02BD4|nr:NlpC/P60 family protein [Jatrophihabitans telluris]